MIPGVIHCAACGTPLFTSLTVAGVTLDLPAPGAPESMTIPLHTEGNLEVDEIVCRHCPP